MEKERRMGEMSVLIEFKKLQQDPVGGVYALPSLSNVRVWHGMIVARHGAYRGGQFRFIIRFPDSYPKSCVHPVVTFATPVFHCLVDAQTAVLDLTPEFSKDEPSASFISQLLAYIKRIFYKKDDWDKGRYGNLEAVRLLESNSNRFRAKCQESAKLANKHLYENDTDSSFILSPPQKVHGEVSRRVLGQILSQQKDPHPNAKEMVDTFFSK